jgi:hypothetical protein
VLRPVSKSELKASEEGKTARKEQLRALNAGSYSFSKPTSAGMELF